MSHRSCLYHKKNLKFSHLHLVAKEFCIWLLGRLPWRFHFSKFELWIQRPFQRALDQVCTFSSCWDKPPIALHGGGDRMGRDGTSWPRCHICKKKFQHTAKCSSLKGHRTTSVETRVVVCACVRACARVCVRVCALVRRTLLPDTSLSPNGRVPQQLL